MECRKIHYNHYTPLSCYVTIFLYINANGYLKWTNVIAGMKWTIVWIGEIEQTDALSR